MLHAQRGGLMSRNTNRRMNFVREKSVRSIFMPSYIAFPKCSGTRRLLISGVNSAKCDTWRNHVCTKNAGNRCQKFNGNSSSIFPISPFRRRTFIIERIIYAGNVKPSTASIFVVPSAKVSISKRKRKYFRLCFRRVAGIFLDSRG